MENNTLIELQKVNRRFGKKVALSNISVSIKQGEMAFLTGRSGAGKSTLLRLIAAIDFPDSGTIEIHGKNTSQLRDSQIPHLRRRIGFVFQNHRLLMDRTVFDNVALPLQISGTTRDTINKRVRAALDKVGLRGREKEIPILLSAGEQQRVGIARAIINHPLILLGDEPTGNLDPSLSSDIMQIFSEFNRIGVTTLIASHDFGLVKHFRRRVIELQDGQINKDESPQ